MMDAENIRPLTVGLDPASQIISEEAMDKILGLGKIKSGKGKRVRLEDRYPQGFTNEQRNSGEQR